MSMPYTNEINTPLVLNLTKCNAKCVGAVASATLAWCDRGIWQNIGQTCPASRTLAFQPGKLQGAAGNSGTAQSNHHECCTLHSPYLPPTTFTSSHLSSYRLPHHLSSPTFIWRSASMEAYLGARWAPCWWPNLCKFFLPICLELEFARELAWMSYSWFSFEPCFGTGPGWLLSGSGGEDNMPGSSPGCSQPAAGAKTSAASNVAAERPCGHRDHLCCPGRAASFCAQ
jgi:hypothetical protein